MGSSAISPEKSLSIEEIEEKSRATDRILLIKAKEDAKKRVRDDPSAANISAFEKISALLERYEEKTKRPKELVFKSVKEVLAYAQSRGHKVKRSKLFEDSKSGLLPRNANGEFDQAAVERYLATLDFVATPGTVVNNAWKRQEEKDIQEIRRIKAIADREEFALAVKKGLYLPKEQVWQELAARAAVLRSGLKTAFEARCLEVIDICDGDHSFATKLSDFLSSLLDDALNAYADKTEFEAEIEEADYIEI